MSDEPCHDFETGVGRPELPGRTDENAWQLPFDVPPKPPAMAPGIRIGNWREESTP